MKRWALIVSCLATLGGGVLALLSTLQHMRIVREGFEEASYCALSQTINCDIVNASSYSEFLGVPIAWWGLCYYIVIGLLILPDLLSKRDRRASIAVAWFLALGGIIYSAWLAYIAIAVLGVVCLECMGMYVANIMLVIFLYLGLGMPVSGVFSFIRDYLLAVFGKRSNLGFRPRPVFHALIVAVVFLLGWLIIANVQSGENFHRESMSLDEQMDAFYVQSLHAVTVDDGWPVWGNSDAAVTLVEFSEYQCPFCRLAALNVRPYLQEFKDDLRYVFVHFPLDSACNDQVSHQMHPEACYASRAALCAQAQGDFWAFHDDLFRHQRELGPELIQQLVKERGWDWAAFQSCMLSPATEARLQGEIAAGQKIYVTGTPTILLNGRKVQFWKDPKFLQRVVREEIKRARATRQAPRL